MVGLLDREGYRDQLHKLLPSGRAWPDEADTTVDQLVQALAAQMAEIDREAARLLDEIRPNTTFALLPDWERVAGLPGLVFGARFLDHDPARFSARGAGRAADDECGGLHRHRRGVRGDDHGLGARPGARRYDPEHRHDERQMAVRLVDQHPVVR